MRFSFFSFWIILGWLSKQITHLTLIWLPLLCWCYAVAILWHHFYDSIYFFFKTLLPDPTSLPTLRSICLSLIKDVTGYCSKTFHQPSLYSGSTTVYFWNQVLSCKQQQTYACKHTALCLWDQSTACSSVENYSWKPSFTLTVRTPASTQHMHFIWLFNPCSLW